MKIKRNSLHVLNLAKISFIVGLVFFSTCTRSIAQQSSNWAPDVSLDGSKVLFHSFRSGPAEVYKMDLDGSNLERLTSSNGQDFYAKWSPDGAQIAFYSTREGNRKIFLMNANGSNQYAIVPSDSSESSFPLWSSDGNRIFYLSNTASGNQLWSMNKDGSNRKQLTFTPDAKSDPAVSPDDSKIAYISSKTGFQEIYTVNADGSNEQRITHLNSEKVGRFITGLEWKSDGRLSFGANLGEIGRDWFRTSLYTIELNGSDLRNIISLQEPIY